VRVKDYTLGLSNTGHVEYISVGPLACVEYISASGQGYIASRLGDSLGVFLFFSFFVLAGQRVRLVV